jgi:hypothetical protein
MVTQPVGETHDMDLLTEPIPRSEETVQRLAVRVEENERKSRRFFRNYMIVYVVVIVALCVLPVDHIFALAFGLPGLVMPAIYFWFAVVWRGTGHARTIVREGVAYRAQISEQMAGRGVLSWRVEWNHADDKKRHTFLSNEKGMPRPGSEGVVLIVDGLNVFGVVASGWLYVLDRRGLLLGF